MKNEPLTYLGHSAATALSDASNSLPTTRYTPPSTITPTTVKATPLSTTIPCSIRKIKYCTGLESK